MHPVPAEIERYLRTGETDMHHRAWTPGTFLERATRAHDDLRSALIAEVQRRGVGAVIRELPAADELAALVRRKTGPMIRGLFPRAEQEVVLALVERSVVFLTPGTIAPVLRDEAWDGSAWDLANLYLGSIGAELLGPDAPVVVGMSQEATCYVSPAYFDDVDPFSDYIVHEVAHIFHNHKRRTVGLPFTRRREWMLDIAFRKRETFAWSCEAFARIAAGALQERNTAAARFAERFRTSEERVDPAEVVDIVREATGRRNGWKVIRARCAPSGAPT